MIKNIKVLIVGICCVIFAIPAMAQQFTTITGSFTQRKNYEITILGNADGKLIRTTQYFMDTTTNRFSIKVPFLGNIPYEMRITVMKQGKRRLEVDYTADFPLKLVADQKLNLSLNPTLFKAKKGLTILKLPAKLTTVTVSGTVKNVNQGNNLSLEKVVEGRSQPIQTNYITKADSTFSFAVPIEKEGFYYLTTPRYKKLLYLKPNDQLDLVFDLKTGLELSAPKTTAANQLINQWEQLSNPLRVMVMMGTKPNREEFTALYKPFQDQVVSFLQQVKTSNAKFNSLFKTGIELDNNLLALNMLLKSSTYKVGNFTYLSRDFLNVPDYYQQVLRKNNIKSAQIMQFAGGEEYVNSYAKFSLSQLTDAQKKALSETEKVKLLMSAITNDTLKSVILKAQLLELEMIVPNYTEFKETFVPYRKYANRPSVKQRYDFLSNQFAADTAFIGKSAYDFTLPDVNGKMVSMKEFKGKVVLIDVWATWCGPCKAQMPFLKEVEEHYKGNNNVVFVGISTDALKDKEKWLNLIKEKQLEGIQLLDDVGKSFGRKYRILSIPRFLMIDKNGNWAEVRCPLPENKEKLIRYIDRELSRNI